MTLDRLLFSPRFEVYVLYTVFGRVFVDALAVAHLVDGDAVVLGDEVVGSQGEGADDLEFEHGEGLADACGKTDL